MKRCVVYPARPTTQAALGYNLGGLYDNTHVDLAVAGGASIVRTQFGWNGVENYATGALALSPGETAFLSYCASKNVEPLIVCAYGPPWVTLGTLVTTADVPSGSAAGTVIPVQDYTFPIDYPYCFAGGLWYTPGALTGEAAYYGSLITSATANGVTLGRATSTNIAAGTSIQVQRLRYPPPSSDTDPSNAAFVRYATFIGEQIAAAGANGYVTVWNEYVWPNDPWDSLANFYDTVPSTVTTSTGMAAILDLCKQQTLPDGVYFSNGVSDKTGFTAVYGPSNIVFNELHPYGNNPEEQAWDFWARGYNGEYPMPGDYPADYNHAWYEVVNPVDQTTNFRYMAGMADLVPGSPALLASETGRQTADDVEQARWVTRSCAESWGLKVIPVYYILDDGSPVGSDTFSLAPSGTVRPAYTALQAMLAVVSRMVPGDDQTLTPVVVSWGSDEWPLMASQIVGAEGHSVTFLWQLTNSSDTSINWNTIPSPPAFDAQVSMPAGTVVAECFTVRTGVSVATSVANGLLTVPVADDVVALRLAPA